MKYTPCFNLHKTRIWMFFPCCYMFDCWLLIVVTCSALIVSHRHSENRCGGHLKILIQAHCPLMFLSIVLYCPLMFSFNVPQPTFCIVSGVWCRCCYGFPLLPPMIGFAWYTHLRITRMTDWRTRITSPHPICHRNHPESFMCCCDFSGTWNTSGIQAVFSFNVHSLCTVQPTVCEHHRQFCYSDESRKTSVMDSILLHLPFAGTCNWILIFDKADKCLPCRSNSMPDQHL